LEQFHLNWVYVLIGAILASLLLELAGTPEGFRKLGRRPHIAAIKIVIAVSLIIYYWLHEPTSLRVGITHFNNDSLARIAIIFVTLVFIIMGLQSIINPSASENERGEKYALANILLLVSIVIIHSGDLLIIVIGCSMWFWAMIGAASLIDTDRNRPEALAKFTFLGLFLFLLFATGLCISYGAVQDVSFAAIASAAQVSSLGKAALSFNLVSVLCFLGLFPFGWMHIDLMDSNTKLFSTLMLIVMMFVASTILLRFMAAIHEMGAYSETLHVSLVVLCSVAFALPVLRALDQQRIARMCAYLIYLQPAVVLLVALSPNTIGSAQIHRFFFANAILGIIGITCATNSFRHILQTDPTWEEIAGAGRSHPYLSATFMLALASLVGFPGTLGFSLRMAIVDNAIAHHDYAILLIVGGSSFFAAMPVIRLAVFLFAKPVRHELTLKTEPKEGLITIICGAILLIFGIVPTLLHLFA